MKIAATYFAEDDHRSYWCSVDEADLEIMYYALAEVGLTPDKGGGGWFGWDRELTDAEFALVLRAEELSVGVR